MYMYYVRAFEQNSVDMCKIVHCIFFSHDSFVCELCEACNLHSKESCNQNLTCCITVFYLYLYLVLLYLYIHVAGGSQVNSHKSRGRYLLSKTVNPADPKSKTQQQAALGMFSFSRYMYIIFAFS